MMVDRESILASRDYETCEVEVPKWGGTVILRTLGFRDRVELERRFGDITEGSVDGIIEAMVWILVRCIVDEDGDTLFSDEDREAFETRDGMIIQQLFTAWADLSKTSLDEIVGNSGGGQQSASPTASP